MGNLAVRFYKNHNTRFILFAIVVSCLIILVNAGVVRSSWLGIVGGACIFAIAAQGFNILLGYSGLVSLGTAGFMGLGAYISAYVTVNVGLPWEMGILSAVAVSVAIGLIIGLVTLRLGGMYLAIVTLCLSEVLRKTFEELEALTGGFSGKKAEYPTLFFGLFKDADGAVMFRLDQAQTYILLVVVMVLLMMLTRNMMSGQLGRALNTMRGSPVAAQMMGISLLKNRMIAFALATGYASLAGALYAHFVKFVYPSTWGLPLSLNILAIIVIGGMRSIYGAFFGAIVVYALPDLVYKRIPVVGGISGFYYVVSGLLIILVMRLYRGGMAHIAKDIKTLIAGKLAKRKEARNG